MTFGSLFAGIGGLDLGLERAGMKCKWQVEINEFCQRVLSAKWPVVRRLRDVRDVSASTVETVDLICGGFPCQPVSAAGQRKGEADSRWLWPEFSRVVAELRPRIVLLENVPGLLTLGGAEVVTDLATLGYDAEWDIVPAEAVGAWHKRERWFCVAHDPMQRERRLSVRQGRFRVRIESESERRRSSSPESVSVDADSGGPGCERLRQSGARNQETRGGARKPKLGNRAELSNTDCNHDGQVFDTDDIRKRIGNTAEQTGDANISGPQEHASVFGNAREELASAFRTNRSEGGVWWRSLPAIWRVVYGVSKRLEQGGLVDEAKAARQTLQAMWSEDESKEIWESSRRLFSVQETADLLAIVSEPICSERKSNSKCLSKASTEALEVELRELWGGIRSPVTSHRRRLVEQQSVQPSDFVRVLSHAFALGYWQESTSEEIEILQSLWLNIGTYETRDVRKALPEIQEAWKNIPEDGKRWITLASFDGLWSVEWPDCSPLVEPRSVPNRVARIRGLGNAVVPQVAEWIGRRIMEVYA